MKVPPLPRGCRTAIKNAALKTWQSESQSPPLPFFITKPITPLPIDTVFSFRKFPLYISFSLYYRSIETNSSVKLSRKVRPPRRHETDNRQIFPRHSCLIRYFSSKANLFPQNEQKPLQFIQNSRKLLIKIRVLEGFS